ncbi:hypothetical protein OBK23_13325 [Empedobacter falsenii]|uniref:hypothetical protein n=1 Tax=Empedobacter falsenii TaxID=343874 RepID=UPI003A7FD2A3
MKAFKLFFFWSHFILFVLQQLNFSESTVSLLKFSIGSLYAVCILLLLVFYKVRLSLKDLVLIGIVTFFVIAKILVLKSINIAVIYWLLCFFCFSKMNWKFEEFLKLVNYAAIAYFVVSILLVYGPLKGYFSYEVRELENRFIPSINRFIGIEGSPAGPDLFYTIVLVMNIYYKKFKYLFFSPAFIIACLVIVWTASLSNLVSLALAILVYLCYKFRIIAITVLFCFFLISTYLINRYGYSMEFILNTVTTLRANIWLQVLTNMSNFNTFEEWVFGRIELMEFLSVGAGSELYDANPHNLGLFAYQFLGVPLFILLVYLLVKYISKIPKGIFFFIIAFMISYSVTNTMPFTTRGNPVIIYLFAFCLFNYNQNEKRLSNTVSQRPTTG